MDQAVPFRQRSTRIMRKNIRALRTPPQVQNNYHIDSPESGMHNLLPPRRPSLPMLTSGALSGDFLPGILPQDADYTSLQHDYELNQSGLEQSADSQPRPPTLRSQSNDEDLARTNAKSARGRLRTRTLDGASSLQKGKAELLPVRQLDSAGESTSQSRRGSAAMGGQRSGQLGRSARRGSNQDTLQAWGTARLMEALQLTRGIMQGHVCYCWGVTQDWQLSYCCINDQRGSLLYEKTKNKSSTDNVLVLDLRGALVRVSYAADRETRLLNVRPVGMTAILHLAPIPSDDFESWFAAFLYWQDLGQQQLPNGEVMSERPPRSPTNFRRRSSANLPFIKDAAIIKVGKMLTLVDDETEATNVKSDKLVTDDAIPGPKWREVSCVLKDDGKLKVYVSTNAIVLSVVRLSKLPRGAVQRLEPSALGADYCIAIYPQYAFMSNASSQLRPIVLCFESRILQEVWFVLCRAFAAPGLYTIQQQVSVDSLQSPEILPGLSRSLSSVTDHRIEWSLSVQVNEITFRRIFDEGSDELDGGRFVLDDLNGCSTGSYVTQISLDGQVRSKTTVRHSSDNKPSWYEKFDFTCLPNRKTTVTVSVFMYNAVDGVPQPGSGMDRSPSTNFIDSGGDKELLCGQLCFNMEAGQLTSKPEDWWQLHTSNGKHVGDIKLKLKYTEAVILVDSEYHQLSEILHHFTNGLTIQIAEKMSTELVGLASCLLDIFQVSGQASDWLMSLAEEEVDGVQRETPPSRLRFTRRLESNESNESNQSSATREAILRDLTRAATGEVSLLFRGNTLFTKAMDIHMKRLGKEYLEETIGEKMRSICRNDLDCEVDPNKAGLTHDYGKARRQLLMLTGEVWDLICHSASRCPLELRLIFRHVRACAEARYGDLQRNVKYSSVSGFLFLRFFCPAIFSPKLFGLVKETPKPRAQRTFTLIAKTLQALANLVTLGQKESWMEPMNQFIITSRHEFKNFIDEICSTASERNELPVVSPSYSTPLAIFTRIPPAAREGFPSLPYLIDHSAAFATLVRLWLDAYAAASRTPLPLSPSKIENRVNAMPALEGNLLRFHTLCLDIRQRTDECAYTSQHHLRRAKVRREEEPDDDGVTVQEKWIATVDRVRNQPMLYFDPSMGDVDQLPTIAGLIERSSTPGRLRMAENGRPDRLGTSDGKRSRPGTSGAVIENEYEARMMSSGNLFERPDSREGERGEGRSMFGLFGRRRKDREKNG